MFLKSDPDEWDLSDVQVPDLQRGKGLFRALVGRVPPGTQSMRPIKGAHTKAKE